MNVPDNYDLFESHEAEQAKQLDKLPECAYCGEPITDEYAFYIEGEWYCDQCMKENFRREVIVE